MNRLPWTTLAATLMLVSPAARAANVLISDMRIAMELEEGSMFVKEIFSVQPMGEEALANSEGLVVPLPDGAQGADLAEDMPSEGISITMEGVRLEGAIPKEGRRAALMFVLPVNNGEMSFVQNTGLPIMLAHAALVGDMEGATLTGDGFGPSDTGETSSGLPARFIAGKDFKEGRIRVTVAGLGSDWMGVLTAALTILSCLLLAAGLVLWIKGRLSKDPEFA